MKGGLLFTTLSLPREFSSPLQPPPTFICTCTTNVMYCTLKIEVSAWVAATSAARARSVLGTWETSIFGNLEVSYSPKIDISAARARSALDAWKHVAGRSQPPVRSCQSLCWTLTVCMVLWCRMDICRGHSMRWLRLVGSLKFYLSFAEYSLFYRALL